MRGICNFILREIRSRKIATFNVGRVEDVIMWVEYIYSYSYFCFDSTKRLEEELPPPTTEPDFRIFVLRNKIKKNFFLQPKQSWKNYVYRKIFSTRKSFKKFLKTNSPRRFSIKPSSHEKCPHVQSDLN